LDLAAQVACEIQRLGEDLRHRNGGTEIYYDASRQLRDDRGELVKVRERRFTDRGTIGGRMHMSDVRAQSHMHSCWRIAYKCGRKDAVRAELQLALHYFMPDRFAESATFFGSEL